MRKIILLAMLLTIAPAFAGCGNKDAEFKAFSAEFEKVIDEMVAKIDADPTEDGVDAAQAVLVPVITKTLPVRILIFQFNPNRLNFSLKFSAQSK